MARSRLRAWKNIALVLLLLWGGCIVLGHWSRRAEHWPRRWEGRVIDRSTGLPLAGATVSLVWGTIFIVQMDGGENFLSATETVTDEDGRFSLSAAPGSSFNLLCVVGRPPRAMIVKPGYSYGDGLHLTWGKRPPWEFSTEISLVPCSSADIEMLPPLTYFPFLSLCRGSDRLWCVPPEAVPRLNEVLKDSTHSICFDRNPARASAPPNSRLERTGARPVRVARVSVSAGRSSAVR